MKISSQHVSQPPGLLGYVAAVLSVGAQMRRLALELRPMLLETAGLDATLRWLAEQYQQRTGMVAEVIGQATEVPGKMAIACFRVAQEALTNVVRHAKARHVGIELTQGEGLLQLVVHDDGEGFDVGRTLEQAAAAGNLGLIGMRERVEILGGRLPIESRPGEGTRVCVSLPLREPAAAPTQQRA